MTKTVQSRASFKGSPQTVPPDASAKSTSVDQDPKSVQSREKNKHSAMKTPFKTPKPAQKKQTKQPEESKDPEAPPKATKPAQASAMTLSKAEYTLITEEFLRLV